MNVFEDKNNKNAGTISPFFKPENKSHEQMLPKQLELQHEL